MDMNQERRLSTSSISDFHPQARQFLRAAYDGDLEKVISMLEDGIPVDVSNSAGLQGIHFAAKTGDVEMVEKLLQRGALANATSLKGNTPLHVAALIGNRDVVKLLLREGVAVNAVSECNEDSFTPLYMAAQIGHQEIVMLLLAHGANPSMTTGNGSTARDVALQQGHQVIAELLAEYERRLKQTENGEVDPAAMADSLLNSALLIPIRKGSSASRAESVERVRRRPPPAVYNRDVIPSPRNSPMKTKATTSNARITTLINDAA